jgi:nucleoside-diphosphate-sugar epimerase
MRFDLAINAMTKRALQGLPILLDGDGSQYRPFLHVKDASKAIMLLIEEDSCIINKQIFNVGNSKMNFMIKDLVFLVQKFFPDSRIEKVEKNKDNRSYKVNFKKFERICGFEAEIDLEKGLEELKSAHENDLLKDMDNEIHYNVEVMKKIIKEPVFTYSLISTPRWNNSDD